MADVEVLENGSSVQVSVSDRIVIRLPENATTGYQWIVTDVGEPLEIVSNDFLPPGQLIPGAGGHRVIVARPRHSGRARVAAALKRSWEPEPVDHFECHVDVAG